MRIQKYSIFVGVVALAVCNPTALRQLCLPQTTSSEIAATKLDDYGNLSTDDEAARLDLFADKLFKQPKLRGQIIAYCEPKMERGWYLRRIHGIGKYLTYARGIEANRVAVVDGGYRQRLTTELWLIPEDANPPLPGPTLPQPPASISSAYKFDAECLDCAPAVGLYLYALDDGLKFYAEELRKHTGARAIFIVRPDQDVSIRIALNEAHKARRLLIKSYGIEADRITVRSARSLNDGTAVVEMWVVPAGAKFRAVTSHKALQLTAR